VIFPCGWQSTSIAIPISRRSRKVANACRRSLTQWLRTTQLGAVMLWGASWSRSSTKVLRNGSGPWPIGPIHSLAVGCWISPSDTTPRAVRHRDRERSNSRCRHRAQRHQLRSPPDQARSDPRGGRSRWCRGACRSNLAVLPVAGPASARGKPATSQPVLRASPARIGCRIGGADRIVLKRVLAA
jgi:hypothetical protein